MRALGGMLRGLSTASLATLVITLSNGKLEADIKNWQTNTTIPGTEGIAPRPGIDLSFWNSDEFNLQYADFSGGVDLSHASFTESWLYNALFTDANLVGANLGAAKLNGANLTGANLDDAYLEICSLGNATLQLASWL